jgi:hypothetical protein
LTGCGRVGPPFASVLEKGLLVTGSATFEVQTKDMSFPGMTQSETWGEWTLKLGVENRTGEPLRLDNTIILVEENATLSQYHGFMLVKEKRVRKAALLPVIGSDSKETWVDYTASYGPVQYEAFDGREVFLNQNGTLYLFHVKGPGTDWKSGAYGTLANGKSLKLEEKVSPYSWFEGAHRQSVCVVLPEIHREAGGKPDSFQPIAAMQQAGDANHWKTGRLIVLHETPAVLAAALTSNGYGPFAKTLAAIRLAEYYPEQAGPAFAAAAANLREGELLASMIDLATRMKTKALEARCRDLASDEKVPKGISAGAKKYLKAIEGPSKPATEK